jgi:cell division protein FtsL
VAAVDWFSVTAPVPAPPPARRGRKPIARPAAQGARPTPKTRASGRRLTGGIVWISLFALLLTGVVALNVAVLRTNMTVNRLDKTELQLRAENAALASQVSSAASASRIEATARKLGLVPAQATDTTYLDLEQK